MLWIKEILKMLNDICNILTCNTTKTGSILNFINDIYVGDIISCLSIVFVIIGGCFGYHQWKKSVKIKRAEYLNELTEKIRTDEDISEMIYILDYKQAWYDNTFHQSGEFERKMDKTLSYFSYICYLFDNNLIEKSEFNFFKYEIDRILMNRSTINYFYNLYHFSEKCGAPITFKFLFEYGEKQKLFDKEFYNSKSDEYPHNLNF